MLFYNKSVFKTHLFDQGSTKIKEINEYHANYIYGTSSAGKLAVNFKLDANENLISAKKYTETTEVVTHVYEYYPNTKYDNKVYNIKYMYFLNSDGAVRRMNELVLGTAKIKEINEYHANYIYGTSNVGKLAVNFKLDANENVLVARKYTEGTGVVTHIYEYYTGTKYENKTYNIQYVYYVNSGEVVRSVNALVQGTGKIKEINDYYANYVYGASNVGKLAVNFKLDANENVLVARKYTEGTGVLTHIYEYYAGTKYSNIATNIQYVYFMNSGGIVRRVNASVQGTGKIKEINDYHPNYVYGASNFGKLAVNFKLDANENVLVARKYKEGTDVITNIYEYFPNTKYENIATRIQYNHNMNSNGTIKNVYELEVGTAKVLRISEHFSGTTYENRSGKIQFLHNMNSNGTIRNVYEFEAGTARVLRISEHFSGTTYENRSGKLQFVHNMNSAGHIDSVYEYQSGTGKLINIHTHHGGTTYENRFGRIRMTFNINDDYTISRSILIGDGIVTNEYIFLAGTYFNEHTWGRLHYNNAFKYYGDNYIIESVHVWDNINQTSEIINLKYGAVHYNWRNYIPEKPVHQFINPLPNGKITTYFGENNHKGLDISSVPGNDPGSSVYATASGTVV